MICQDGYFVSHISGEVQLPTMEQMDSFLPPYKHPFALDPNKPVSHGPQIHPEQGPPLQLERVRAIENSMPVIREKTDEFGEIFGRKYPHFVEGYMLEDADVVFVMQGAHAVTCRAAVKRARERGIKAGLARLLWFRPFPTEDLQKALAGCKVAATVETNLCMGGAAEGGALALDVTTAMYHADNHPLMTSFMAGLGGETVTLEEFAWMTDKMVQAMERGHVEKTTHWVNFED
jgi:pyruvate/2-oxoacid:ferredoxin oxidoreductase alpha subunit